MSSQHTIMGLFQSDTRAVEAIAAIKAGPWTLQAVHGPVPSASIMVSGKPVMSLVPFFIVGFEFTILFAVFGNVIGLIHQMQLPCYKNLAVYDERCSGQHYGVVAACGPDEHEALAAFFKDRGAVVREFLEG